MAILNLRSEEPTHDTVEDHTLDETPPGLEAIRAWFRKPRPWLHGIRLWIREFAKWWRAFRKWAAKNAVPAARRAAELAASGAEAARALARAGEIAADGAKHIAEMGRAWGPSGGRTGRIGEAIAIPRRTVPRFQHPVGAHGDQRRGRRGRVRPVSRDAAASEAMWTLAPLPRTTTPDRLAVSFLCPLA